MRMQHSSQLSDAELLLQQVVHRLRIGLAARGFHRLPDEPPGELWLFLSLRDLVDDPLDRAEVGDLLHAARVHDRARIATFAPDYLEQVLCDLAGDRAFGD